MQSIFTFLSNLYKIIAAFFGSASPGPNPASTEVAKYLQLNNVERHKSGVPELILDSRLCKAAQIQADYMAKMKIITHVGEGGTTPGNRLSSTGFKAQNTAENIGARSDAATFVEVCMNSQYHRINMLARKYTHVGVGITVSDQKYWCIVFANIGESLLGGICSGNLINL